MKKQSTGRGFRRMAAACAIAIVSLATPLAAWAQATVPRIDFGIAGTRIETECTGTTGHLYISTASALSTDYALTSSAPGVLSVPAQVTMPAGQTHATFLVDAQTVTADTPVTLSARRAGTKIAVSESITVLARPQIVSVAVSPAPVAGPATATVTLNRERTCAFDAKLVSSDPSALRVEVGPLRDSIQSANLKFPLTPGWLETGRGVKLTATLGSSTKTIAVTAGPTPSTLSSLSIPERLLASRDGITATGGVGINGRFASDAQIALRSSHPNLQVPATVTVPANGFSAPVPLTVVSAMPEGSTARVIVTARLGTKEVTDVIDLAGPTPPPPLTIGVVSKDFERPIFSGSSGLIRYALSRADSVPHTIQLATDSTLLRLPTSVSIPAGQLIAEIRPSADGLTPTSAPVSAKVSARLDGVGTAVEANLQIVPPAPAVTLSGATMLTSDGPAETLLISVNPALTKDETVQFFSNGPSFVVVPASVVLPAGASQASIPVRGMGVAAGGQNKTLSVRIILRNFSGVVSYTVTPAAPQ